MRARAIMAEDDDYNWAPLIVLASLFALFLVCVCCCVAPSKDRSLWWYTVDFLTGERSRRKRAEQAPAKDGEQPSAAMLPSLPSLSAIRLDAL